MWGEKQKKLGGFGMKGFYLGASPELQLLRQIYRLNAELDSDQEGAGEIDALQNQQKRRRANRSIRYVRREPIEILNEESTEITFEP
jgi:hypothetical protein